MDRTVCARLQFDGTRFAGWQLQPGERTVQRELEAAFGRLADRPTRVHAAGRTDAGVHALGMAVSAVVPARWEAEPLRRALNAILPPDIWVEQLVEVRTGFHARRSAEGRAYMYRLGTDEAARSPFRSPHEWALAQAIDATALTDAAATLVGTHDCTAFAVQTALKRHCICTIREARWAPRPGGQGFEFHVAADRFLHHMVRILVGTMVDIGRGRRPVDDMRGLLAREPGVRASAPAPPAGLYFVKALYPAHWFELGETTA